MKHSPAVQKSLIHRFERPQKQLALLMDPDSYDSAGIHKVVSLAVEANADFIFVGGSLLISNKLDEFIATIKQICTIPVVLFPGSPLQVSRAADGILFLSVISGRNPEALIGHHVIAAPSVKASGLAVLPTGYMLVDSGVPTTASYMSNTTPIPYDKPDIAACTAMAGEMLGLRLIYLDGGSGAKKPISARMIARVKQSISVPLIVGGGLRTPAEVENACTAGADVVVIGNAIEKDAALLKEMAAVLQ